MNRMFNSKNEFLTGVTIILLTVVITVTTVFWAATANRMSQLFVDVPIFNAAMQACETFGSLKYVKPDNHMAYCQNGYKISISPHFQKAIRAENEEAKRKAEEKLQAINNEWAGVYTQRCIDISSSFKQQFRPGSSTAVAMCENGYFVNYESLTENQIKINKLIEGESLPVDNIGDLK